MRQADTAETRHRLHGAGGRRDFGPHLVHRDVERAVEPAHHVLQAGDLATEGGDPVGVVAMRLLDGAHDRVEVGRRVGAELLHQGDLPGALVERFHHRAHHASRSAELLLVLKPGRCIAIVNHPRLADLLGEVARALESRRHEARGRVDAAHAVRGHVDARHQRVEDRAAEAGPGILHGLVGSQGQVLIGPFAPSRLLGLPPRLERIVGRHARARRGAHLPGIVVGVGDVVEGVADPGAGRVQPVPGDVLQRLHCVGHGLGCRGHLHNGAGRAAVRPPEGFGQLAVELT